MSLYEYLDYIDDAETIENEYHPIINNAAINHNLNQVCNVSGDVLSINSNNTIDDGGNNEITSSIIFFRISWY